MRDRAPVEDGVREPALGQAVAQGQPGLAGADDDGGDVTYINEKNKQFNEKLNRFYNRYTTEIRENFERGTAI